ncbi:hypothetical protein EMIT0P74_50052 [Pseudomonas sp. IT-P74]
MSIWVKTILCVSKTNTDGFSNGGWILDCSYGNESVNANPDDFSLSWEVQSRVSNSGSARNSKFY